MYIADAHCDTLHSMAIGGKPRQSLSVTAERLRAGGVGLQTFAMFAGSLGPAGTPYEDGLRMLNALDELETPICRGALPAELGPKPLGVVSIEGGEMLRGSLETLREFHAACRIRMLALTWNHENEIGYPAKSGDARGLKPFGKALLREMGEMGILADVSHLNEAGFWDVAEYSQLPPVASHSNLRFLCDHFRNLTRPQARFLIEAGGFIGVNFYGRFLANGRPATVEDVVRQIDAIAELGGIHSVGFGSDFDGIDEWPDGLANPADFPALLARLRKAGYTEAELEGIAGGNLWRVLKNAERGR